MKGFILLVLTLLANVINVSGQNIPSKFEIGEEMFNWGTCFSVGKDIKINEKIFEFTSSFELLENGETCVEAVESLLSFGSRVKIYNKDGKHVGTMQERVFESWGIYSKYEILDPSGKLLATSEKVSLSSTSFKIRSPKGEVICKMRRDMLNLFRDTWRVEIFDKDFDRRLIIFIPCYKTLKDNGNP